MSRFAHVKLDDKAESAELYLRKVYQSVAKALEAMPSNRASSLALTKLEESFMWASKTIRDDQIRRNSPVKPVRTEIVMNGKT